jgi:hypothetical protein
MTKSAIVDETSSGDKTEGFQGSESIDYSIPISESAESFDGSKQLFPSAVLEVSVAVGSSNSLYGSASGFLSSNSYDETNSLDKSAIFTGTCTSNIVSAQSTSESVSVSESESESKSKSESDSNSDSASPSKFVSAQSTSESVSVSESEFKSESESESKSESESESESKSESESESESKSESESESESKSESESESKSQWESDSDSASRTRSDYFSESDSIVVSYVSAETSFLLQSRNFIDSVHVLSSAVFVESDEITASGQLKSSISVLKSAVLSSNEFYESLTIGGTDELSGSSLVTKSSNEFDDSKSFHDSKVLSASSCSTFSGSTGSISVSPIHPVSLSSSRIFSVSRTLQPGREPLVDPNARGGALSTGTIGGIVGAILGVLAITVGMILFFVVRTRKSTSSHEMSATAETDPSCTNSTDQWEDDEDFGYEHVNPDVEPFQDDDFFVDTTIEEGAF